MYMTLACWLKMAYRHEIAQSNSKQEPGQFALLVMLPAFVGAMMFSTNEHVWHAYTHAEVSLVSCKKRMNVC